MKIQEDILKEIILKNDLQYALNENEQDFFLKMTPDEVCNIREGILTSIQNKDLSLDVLEDYLTSLKEIEYRKYLEQGGIRLDVEEQMEKLAELEGRCTQMVINIAKGMATRENLLGPSIHDTYGVGVKN